MMIIFSVCNFEGLSRFIEISLLWTQIPQYFEEGMIKSHLDCSTTEEMTEFLASILNDTMYPIASSKTSGQEIHLSYRPKSFADPIF